MEFTFRSRSRDTRRAQPSGTLPCLMGESHHGCHRFIPVTAATRFAAYPAPLLARGESHRSADELIATGTRLRAELLRATHVHVGGVEVALAIHAGLMHAPEAAGELAGGAPRKQDSPVQVVRWDPGRCHTDTYPRWLT